MYCRSFPFISSPDGEAHLRFLVELSRTICLKLKKPFSYGLIFDSVLIKIRCFSIDISNSFSIKQAVNFCINEHFHRKDKGIAGLYLSFLAQKGNHI